MEVSLGTLFTTGVFFKLKMNQKTDFISCFIDIFYCKGSFGNFYYYSKQNHKLQWGQGLYEGYL